MAVYDKVRDQIEKYNMISAGDTVIAAVSGGADSICLLLMLKRYASECDFTLKAIHVEHGIRGEESLLDAAFTDELCRKYGIECRIVSVDAPKYAKAAGRSLEEAARELRYRAFEEACRTGATAGDGEARVKVATAHNLNDQAETIIFQMARGTRSRGLCGIPAVRDYLIRPLLAVSREEIEAELADMGQDFCTDSTNLIDDYSRNIIRHRVLPELTGINSDALGHINELALHMQAIREDIDGRVEEFCEKYVTEAVSDGGSNSVTTIEVEAEALTKESRLMRQEILHFVMERACGTKKDISADHIEAVDGLRDKGTGKSLDMPYGVTVRTEYGRLIFEKKSGQVNAGDAERDVLRLDFLKEMQPEQKIKKSFGSCDITFKMLSERDAEKIAENTDLAPKSAYTKVFDCDKIGEDAVIRFRENGDRFVIDADGGSKKLKDYFIDEKVPASRRDCIPLVARRSEVYWIVGMRQAFGAKVDGGTKRIVEISFEEVRS